MLKLLGGMGYKMGDWGGTELIEIDPEPQVLGIESSGNDTARSGAVRPGWVCGANDDRRPAVAE